MIIYILIVITFKMTFKHSIEVCNLIDYDMIINECDNQNNLIVDKNNIQQNIIDYCYYNEHKNVIKKIVETFGIYNAIKLYEIIRNKNYNLEKTSFISSFVDGTYIRRKVSNKSHEYNYSTLCSNIVLCYAYEKGICFSLNV